MSTADGAPPQMPEKRRDLRVPLRVEVMRSEDGPGSEYAVNVSPGGACLQSRMAREPGDRLRIRFALASSPEPIEAECEVVWCSSESALFTGCLFFEMGVRFVEIKQRDVAAIRFFVEVGAGFVTDDDTTRVTLEPDES